MLAVLPPSADATGEVRLGRVETPTLASGEVLIRVRATALNRADLLQLRGQYPPPPGESEIPGLECSGVVDRVGESVEGLAVGDRVMALLAGGGQAEYVAAPAGQVMPIPPHLDFAAAAALPEAALTSWTNLVYEGGLAAGKSVLITAAASGIGTFAVQLARELGARVLVAGRNLERLERLRDLGAEACIQLGEDLPSAVRDATSGRGVDLIMDLAGGSDLGRRLGALGDGGRLVLVGILAGPKTSLPLAEVLRRRLRIQGSVLRARSRSEKAELVEAFHRFAAERLEDGRLRPIVHRTRPFSEIADAYAEMVAGGVWGKLVLTFDY